MIQRQPGVTELLESWRNGDAEAAGAILTLVYEELRGLARRCLAAEAPGHTLQPTALVHEVYLRLSGGAPPPAASRRHLLALAARCMRQVLVNHALERRAAKRGGGWRRIALDPAVALFEQRCIDLLALDEALMRLSRVDERLTRLVELRFFGGLSVEETAHVLRTSPRTVERDWSAVRAWLREEVGP